MHEVIEKLKKFRESDEESILLNYYEVMMILDYINYIRENEMCNYDLLNKLITHLGK